LSDGSSRTSFRSGATCRSSVSQAVAILAYDTPANNPTLYREAERWLELVLSER